MRKPGIPPVPPSVLLLEDVAIRGVVSSDAEGREGGMSVFAGLLNDFSEMSMIGVSGRDVSRSFSVGRMMDWSFSSDSSTGMSVVSTP